MNGGERRRAPPPGRRALGFALALAASSSAAPPTAQVDIQATASCERRASKGRVVCDVEIEAPEARIAWADVVVVDAPSFAPPLRSRVGIADARTRTEHRVRLPVALLSTGLGRGKVALRARATVCVPAPGRKAGEETCVVGTRDVTAELVVGADVER